MKWLYLGGGALVLYWLYKNFSRVQVAVANVTNQQQSLDPLTQAQSSTPYTRNLGLFK